MTDDLAASNAGGRRDVFLGAILGLIVCLAAITTRSYWLDEAGVAYKASLPSLGEWWHSLKYGDANLQLPLYHIFARGWAQLVGINEFALRAGNALWFIPGLIIFLRAVERDRRVFWSILLVVLISPFVWYYLNEARPYAMQIGASLAVLGALYRIGLTQEEKREGLWVRILCCASIVLAGSGMLAMLWLGAYLGAAALATPKLRLRYLGRVYWRTGIASGLVLLTIGCFYLWTLTLGTRATNVGQTDARNLLFIGYELFGFSGLGPGRLAIRNGGFGSFAPWLACLSMYAVFLGLVLAPGAWRLAKSVRGRTVLIWTCAFGIVAAFILGVGVAMHFRVLGRHFAPVYALFAFAGGTGVAELLRRRSWVRQATVAGFIVLALSSALSLRLSSRHAKDDYRGAALLGVEALQKGEVVWWNADPDGASIYHLPLVERGDAKQGAHFIMNPGKAFERNMSKPDLVLTSKADVYDQYGAIRDYLIQGGFEPSSKLPAFTAWRARTK